MLFTTKITSSLFPELYETILRDWNANLSREQWQRAFTGRWECEEDYFGYALADGSRIVGMLGMLFSERFVAGRPMRFCNLHSWYVSPEYRSKSLALLKPVVALKDHIVTDFTPGPAVSAISKRLGFKPLKSDVLILPPMPPGVGRSRASVIELQGDNDPGAAQMEAADHRIYLDHLNLDCGHMVARDGDEYCYLVYSRIADRGLPYCLIHYVSNRQLFARQQKAIRKHLLDHGKSRFAVLETRLAEGERVPLTFRTTANEKLYCGKGIAPHQIDTLYSEIVLLKHSPLPSLSQRLRATAKRCIPPAVRRYMGIGGRRQLPSSASSHGPV